jgi:vancomycin resistance protein YoaR
MSRKHTKTPKTKTPEEVKPVESKKIRRFSRGKIVFFSAAGVVIILVGSATAYAFHYNNRYLPRTVVGGVAIGGMTREEATAAVSAKEDAFLHAALSVVYQDKKWNIIPADFGFTASAQSQLDQLWQSQQGDTWSAFKKLFSAPLSTRYSSVSISGMTDEGKQVMQKQVLSTIETAMQETSLTFSTREVAIVAGKAGQKLDQTDFEDRVGNAFSDGKPVALTLAPARPEVTSAMAVPAQSRATELLKAPLTMHIGTKDYSIDPTTLASWLYSSVTRDGSGAATGLTLMLTHGYTDAMQTWRQTAETAPTNARLSVDQGGIVSVVQQDIDGVQVNENATYATLSNYLNSNTAVGAVLATVAVKKAEVRQDTFVSLGLTGLVGTGTTDYTGSPTGRVINIKKGASSINQILIKSGDTFSTVGQLAPIDISHGYVNELVIKGNRTVPDAGGGLCQVSTTLFRSVLNAGLPIVERANHAYRVSYYERGTGPGLDATIYDPSPDFKWKNDYASNLFVQSHVEGTKITFDIYGTKEGRVVAISPPTILETYLVGDPIYANTDTLPAGTTKQIEHPHDGAKTSVSYTVTKDGQQIYSKTFVSVYRAWPAQFLVGTGPAADPTPTP